MNANRRTKVQEFVNNGVSPKEAYEMVKKLNLIGYRKPEKLEKKKNERKKSKTT